MKIRIALFLPALLAIAIQTEASVQIGLDPLQDNRCSTQIRPICGPGQQAICICESRYSLRCQYVCGSQ